MDITFIDETEQVSEEKFKKSMAYYSLRQII